MKLLVRLLLGVLLVLVLAAAGTALFVDSLVKAGVERGGTLALGVETSLDEASIGLFSGRFTLQGLTIANPPGFAAPDFFSMRATDLELPISELLKPSITIPSLVLDGISLDLERNSQGTNYDAILENLQRFESEAASPEAASSEGNGDSSDTSGKTFLLRSLVIRDVRATVNLLPAGGDLTKLSVAVPEINVEGLGSEMTLAQISALVVKTVIRATIEAGGSALPEELLADLRGRVESLEGGARERASQELERAEQALQEKAGALGPEATQALEKVGDRLDGLLKKKK